MATQRYPIGLQTFSEIIEKGYTYIDKTGYIPLLTEHGKYLFLSRPRRFGKSLLLSTLEAYFEGRRELFRGLQLDSMEVDWSPSPVLHFDFNTGYYKTVTGLLAQLHDSLKFYENEYGIPSGECSPEMIPLRFRTLIREIYEQTGRQVVILVDEYDKPLLDVEDNRELFESHQAILKSFFGNLKTMDRMIRYTFITGVARFNKVSIFSDLNHLRDISLVDKFSDICGITEHELLNSCLPGIESLSLKHKESVDATLKELREWYDGYLFTSRGSRMYNPYSVFCALGDESIESYWFGTGTPSFLVKRIKAMETYPPDLNGVEATHEQLTAVGLHDTNPIPLMFQTGYLTIWRYERELKTYELRYPNREVEIGFYNDLLPI